MLEVVPQSNQLPNLAVIQKTNSESGLINQESKRLIQQYQMIETDDDQFMTALSQKFAMTDQANQIIETPVEREVMQQVNERPINQRFSA